MTFATQSLHRLKCQASLTYVVIVRHDGLNSDCKAGVHQHMRAGFGTQATRSHRRALPSSVQVDFGTRGDRIVVVEGRGVWRGRNARWVGGLMICQGACHTFDLGDLGKEF